MYSINTKLRLPNKNHHSLYILTALKPRHLIICEPHTNLSISIDSLCDTLISIIHAKIALHSHGLSSIQT